MLEKIEIDNITYAIIIYHSYSVEGISFFTPDDYSQQLGYMHHPKGKKILPHIHLPVERTVQNTNEVLFIKRGKVRVDFYDSEECFMDSRMLETGDVILLVEGGHGFEVIEELEMVEVKQGPYAGENDKRRFSPKAKK